MTAPDVTIAPVSAATRSRCEALTVQPDQRRFVVPVAQYIAMCEAEGVWHPVAVLRAGEVVGFAMWAYDAEEGSHWLGGLVVDRRHQRRGIGRAAVLALIEQLPATEVGLSYDADNTGARKLYRSLGFREAGERTEEGEIVARRPASVAKPRDLTLRKR